MSLQISDISTPKLHVVQPMRKVLFVIDTLELGGAEQSLLANISCFKNTIPIVCHIYPGDHLKERFIEVGAKVYSLNVAGSYNFSKAYKLLKEVVIKEAPDVMVGYLTRSELVTRIIGKVNKIPVIGTFVADLYSNTYNKHLSWMAKRKVWFFKQLNKLTSKTCSGFIANSLTIKEANAVQLNIPAHKIKVINRGRDSSRFICKNFNNKKEDVIIRFLNVSRLYHTKGQIELIKAFKRFIDNYPFSELHIVGEGPMRSKLEQQIVENKLEDKVFLLGARNDVPSMISLYDCFIFPSIIEGFSGALVEAMFAGLPILATDISQNKEVVTHLQTGYLFKTGSVQEIENAMIWFKDNIMLATNMAEKAYGVAKQNFELEKIAYQFESYLHNSIIKQN